MLCAPVVGATRLAQLDEALGALDLTLTAADRQLLDDAYTPNRYLGLLR